jgi:large subunit ribosomal protein L32
MALQKRRMGRGRIHSRRSAWMGRIAHKPFVAACPNCQAPRLPHRVCMQCGQYRGETVVEVASKEAEE